MRPKIAACLLVLTLPGLIGSAGAIGVTDEEITVVLYNDVGVNGDMNAPWTSDDESPTHAAMYQERNLVRTIKALRRWFAARYETNGRTVRVIAVASAGGLSSACVQRRGDAVRIAVEYEPFAVASLAEGNTGCIASELADRGIMTLGAMRDVPRSAYLDDAPYVWSLFPDQETEASYAAAFICRSLLGGPARFTADPELTGMPRRFGIIYPQQGSGDWTRGPESEQMAELLQSKTAAQCGMSWSSDPTAPADAHLEARYLDGGTQGGREALTIMNRFQTAGVTTVICYCVPVQNELTILKMQSGALALGYTPEWYFDHGSRMDKAIWHKEWTTRVLQQSFGVSYWWLMPAITEQPASQAYLEQEPGTTPNERFVLDVYNTFLMLYQAIQAGGTNPSPSSIEAGLSGYAQRDPDDPSQPAGGFEPSKPNPYTFIDTAVAW